jgi:hypothetical protein
MATKKGNREEGLDGKKNKTFEPDKVRTIGKFSVGNATETRVVINTFGDRHFVDIRQWYTSKGSNESMPGKGHSIKVEHIDELISLLKQAKARAIKAKLIKE